MKTLLWTQQVSCWQDFFQAWLYAILNHFCALPSYLNKVVPSPRSRIALCSLQIPQTKNSYNISEVTAAAIQKPKIPVLVTSTTKGMCNRKNEDFQQRIGDGSFKHWQTTEIPVLESYCSTEGLMTSGGRLAKLRASHTPFKAIKELSLPLLHAKTSNQTGVWSFPIFFFFLTKPSWCRVMSLHRGHVIHYLFRSQHSFKAVNACFTLQHYAAPLCTLESCSWRPISAEHRWPTPPQRHSPMEALCKASEISTALTP